MNYCTALELRSMLNEDVLSALVGNSRLAEAEREEKILPLLEEAAADATGEIDGYLCKRYPLPLALVPKMVNKLAKDIGVYNLFSRIGIDESKSDKNYLNRYRAAISYLEKVAVGKVDISGDGGGGSMAVPSLSFTISSPPRVMSRENLKGM